MKQLVIVILIFCTGCSSHSQVKFNGNFEILNSNKTKAEGWGGSFQPNQLAAYSIKVDSVVKQQGKYSLSIQKVKDESEFGAINYRISQTFKGEKIQLKGYIKTENVKNGYAGLWLRIDGTTAFDNMQDRGITGTNDWKEYVINLPYDQDKAVNINAGALLVGDGKIWVDNLRLFINDVP